METPNLSLTVTVEDEEELTPEAILERLQLKSNPNSVTLPAQQSHDSHSHSPVSSIDCQDLACSESDHQHNHLSSKNASNCSFDMCIVQSPANQQPQSSRSSSGTLPSLGSHYNNTNLPPPLTRSFSNLTALSTPTSRKSSRRESMFATKSSSVDNYCMQSCEKQRLLVYREIDMYRMRLLETESIEEHALPTILEPCLPSVSNAPSTSTEQKVPPKSNKLFMSNHTKVNKYICNCDIIVILLTLNL